MKSINFPIANMELAKDQPEYKTLHVHLDRFDQTKQFPVTCCLELTEEEVAEIVRTKRVWLTQVTFGRGYSPIGMSLVSPFNPEQSESITVPMDENRTSAEEWDKTHFTLEDKSITTVNQQYYQLPCVNCNEPEHKHYWSTRQCQL